MRHVDDERLRALLVRPGSSVRQAMERIDQAAVEIALMVDDDLLLMGTVTDGDLRRALLAGVTLDDAVDPFVSRSPITVRAGMDRAGVLELMQARSIAHLPEVDSSGRLTGIHLLRDVIGAPVLDNWAVIVAGGRGTRLGEATRSVPKPMLEVAGRPILERIVLHLVGSGIRNVVLSIGYLGEQIADHFGDGADHGCRITYLEESPDHPLGTGGPLRLLLDRAELPTTPLLVMNGDLITSFSVSGLLDAHDAAGAAMTIGVQEHVHDVPFGVVQLGARDEVVALVEKPRMTWPVSAGTYVIEPRLLSRIPVDEPYPVTELARGCLERGERVLGWRLDGEWQDVGRPSELRAARGQA